MAAHRLLSERQAAIADVAAAIEMSLFRKDPGSSRQFIKQENLIRLLGNMENHRSDGEVARLIGHMLDEIQKGADFPFDAPWRPTKDPRHYPGYGELENDVNHSLAWLLLSLDERDAARLLGKRLLKLRDLSTYGWLNEIQHVVDHRHIEDQLELMEIEPGTAALTPIRWQVSAVTENLAHSDQITRASSVDNDTQLKTESNDGVVCVWDIKSGKLNERIGESKVSDDRGPRRPEMVHLSEDRSVQYVFKSASKGHPYGPPTAYTVEVGPPTQPGSSNDEDRDFDEKPSSKPVPSSKSGHREIGAVELKWGQYKPIGLVPDRRHFFIGTHIFRRDDLSLRSAANVSGTIEQVAFSEDGSRYAVVTSNRVERESWTVSIRVTIRDCKTGTAILAIEAPPNGVACVALTRAGDAAAIVGNDKTVQVWPVPRPQSQPAVP